MEWRVGRRGGEGGGGEEGEHHGRSSMAHVILYVYVGRSSMHMSVHMSGAHVYGTCLWHMSVLYGTCQCTYARTLCTCSL